MSEVKLVCNLICRDDVPTHVLPNTRTVLSTLQNREENSAAAHMYTADTITSYCSSNNTVTGHVYTLLSTPTDSKTPECSLQVLD